MYIEEINTRKCCRIYNLLFRCSSDYLRTERDLHVYEYIRSYVHMIIHMQKKF